MIYGGKACELRDYYNKYSSKKREYTKTTTNKANKTKPLLDLTPDLIAESVMDNENLSSAKEQQEFYCY